MRERRKRRKRRRMRRRSKGGGRRRRRRSRLGLMGVKLVSEVDFVPINLVETSKRHRWRCLRL